MSTSTPTLRVVRLSLPLALGVGIVIAGCSDERSTTTVDLGVARDLGMISADGGRALEDQGGGGGFCGVPTTQFARSNAGPVSCSLLVCMSDDASMCQIQAPGSATRCGSALDKTLVFSTGCFGGEPQNLFAISEQGWSFVSTDGGQIIGGGASVNSVPVGVETHVVVDDANGAPWDLVFTWTGTEITVSAFAPQ